MKQQMKQHWHNFFDEDEAPGFQGVKQRHTFSCVGATMKVFASDDPMKRDAEIEQIDNPHAQHLGAITELKSFVTGDLIEDDYLHFLNFFYLDDTKLIAVSSDGPYGLHAIVIYKLKYGIISFYCPYEDKYYETNAGLFMIHAKPKALFLGDKRSHIEFFSDDSIYSTPERKGYSDVNDLQKKKTKFECESQKKILF